LTLIEVGILLRLFKCVDVKVAFIIVEPSTLRSLRLIRVYWESKFAQIKVIFVATFLVFLNFLSSTFSKVAIIAGVASSAEEETTRTCLLLLHGQVLISGKEPVVSEVHLRVSLL
jgi:hypothetical protein